MAEDKKGITVKIDADLHAQVRKYMESHSMTMADFIAAACNDLLHPKIKEEKNMENMRTVAFQVPESLFQRIKDYLHRNNMTQRQFLLGLIEKELDREQAEREAPVEAESEEPNPEEEDAPERESDAEEAFEAENSADGYSDNDEYEEDSEDESEDESEAESQGFVMGM